jgi:AraC-like DNA-binding protein
MKQKKLTVCSVFVSLNLLFVTGLAFGQQQQADNLHVVLKTRAKEGTTPEVTRGRFEKITRYFEMKLGYQNSMNRGGEAKQVVDVDYQIEKQHQLIQLLQQERKKAILWINILIMAVALLISAFLIIYYLQKYEEGKNRRIFNFVVHQLTIQHKELFGKYNDMLANQNQKSVDSLDQRILKRAIEVIEYNISNSSFSVEKMSEEMAMSRTNLHRKIKAITGFPPSELIRSIRLRKAATLLLSHADSVSQISFKVGFDDHSYFSKSFKKQFGVPPSEYLQNRGQAMP